MNRLPYIDAVKGVAILCITLLHYEAGIFPAWLNSWIGAFMVSAFYFTAGWVSGVNGKFYTGKEIFVKRFWQLGVPYFWFSILLLAFDVLFWLMPLPPSLDNFFRDDWCFLLRLIYHPFPKSQILFADCVAFLQGFHKTCF